MHVHELHDWDVTPKEAVGIQRRLRDLVRLEGRLPSARLVAGADCSWDKPTETGHAAVVVLRFPSLEEVERVVVSGPATFPYVPGLLTFREGPLLCEAFRLVRSEPDFVIFDGQGYAHPRRMGVATHMGILLGRPSVGCAKSRLTGEHREPGPKRGNRARLVEHGETVGAALRTREGVKPVYVSAGHALSLAESIRLTLRCGRGVRLPEPTRTADRLVGEARRAALQSP